MFFSFKNRNPLPISTSAAFNITGSFSTAATHKTLAHENYSRFFFHRFNPTPCKCCDYLPLLIYANSSARSSF